MGLIRQREIQNSGYAKVMMGYDPKGVPADVPPARTVNEIIASPIIDAIFISTPNYLNMPLTIQALQHGKHVFCEKPPAFTAEQVKEIQHVEAASGKVLMYGFNHRHHGSVKQMKSLVDSYEYGNVLWMRGRYGKSVDRDFYNNWRASKELAGGGILIDQGIHMLDLFLHIGGNFDKVHATVSNLYWKLDVEDNVFATLENSKTGLVASLHSTMTQWRHLFSLEVFLEKGYMVLNGLKTSSNSYGDETLTIAKSRTAAPMANWQDEEHFTYSVDKSYRSEVEEFFSAIHEHRQVFIGSSEDAVKIMSLVDKIYSYKV